MKHIEDEEVTLRTENFKILERQIKYFKKLLIEVASNKVTKENTKKKYNTRKQ